ncbi:MAG: glycerate kinase family protein [Mycobacteriales bacterium]|nr:MAG: hypothetical protein DLM56_14285 [Pseudonocardiales bacterium]
MRVVVAPDSFGGTLTAPEVAAAIAGGWRRARPGDVVDTRPMSDGGPGFVDVLAATLRGSRVPVDTRGPTGRPVSADILVVDGTAYIEAAAACGLDLLMPAERDPGVTTTHGVGVLIATALEAGSRSVVVGLGGSGTNDGGAGMLAALGVVTRDCAGRPLPYGGAALSFAERVDGSPLLRGASLVAASDVDNPLVGPHGASAVFGPQKGATPDQVRQLDSALARFASVLERDLAGCPPGLAVLPGGGAAGGLGAGLLALGAVRVSGVGLVRRLIGLDDALAGADVVVTGEGSFDRQSLRGKVITGVAESAGRHRVPCVVLAGQVSVTRPEMAAAGVADAYAVALHAGSVRASLAEPAGGLADLAAHVATQWSR